MKSGRVFLILLFSTIFLNSASLLSVIIVVHGTFAANETWCSANGDFVRSLRASFKNLPDSCMQKNSPIVLFRWSGHNNASARVTAARDLGNLVMSYGDDEPVVLVGHSHAGNIITILSKLLRNPLLAQQENALSGAPLVRSLIFSDLSDWDAIVGLPCDDATREMIDDAVNYFSMQYQTRAMASLTRCCGLEGFSHKPALFQKKIHRAYFLGTPVNTAMYQCDMNVVERCYALHSTCDAVQTVLGMYARVFPPCKGLLNLNTVVVTPKGKILGLGHSGLHSPLVGSAVLLVPYIIEQVLKIDASAFDMYPQMVLVLFADGGDPLIIPALRGVDGKLHPCLQERLDAAKKKSPATLKEAGDCDVRLELDYSFSMSL